MAKASATKLIAQTSKVREIKHSRPVDPMTLDIGGG